MKPLLIIALFAISISVIEWGLLQVALDEKLSKESVIFAVVLSSSNNLQHISRLNQHSSIKAPGNKHIMLVSRNRKSSTTHRFDGRTSW